MSDNEKVVLRFDIGEVFENWWESEGKHKASEIDVKGSMEDAFAAGILCFSEEFLESLEETMDHDTLFSVHDAIETEQ